MTSDIVESRVDSMRVDTLRNSLRAGSRTSLLAAEITRSVPRSLTARKNRDRLATAAVVGAFVLALVPLVSIVGSTLANGIARFDLAFFTQSMRGVIGAGGGALHAIVGTLQVTGMAALISVPLGILAAIYVAEYAKGRLGRAIMLVVDVMMGIPSIVAGLFAFALFSLLLQDAGVRSGFIGAIALSVLMIPVVVRSSVEFLQLVPGELREASLALGVPQWRTVLSVVVPTAFPGLTTGVMLAIARVIGETAPLLIVAGFTASMNYNLFDERMMTLPVYVYTQYVSQGPDAIPYLDRAWAGALTLMLIVMLLNLGARLLGRAFRFK